MAAAALGVGDKARALDWLERGVRDHTFYLVFLGCEPTWDVLRAEPRFQALIRQVGVVTPRAGAGRPARQATPPG